MTGSVAPPATTSASGPDVRVHRIAIVLAYHQSLVRRGLRLILDGVDDFVVVEEAESAAGALRAARYKHPRVVILDLDQPDPVPSVMPTIHTLRNEIPEAEIVLINLDGDMDAVRAAIAGGAVACVSFAATPEDLEIAVRRAASGQRHLPTEVMSALATPPEAQLTGLTAREVEIIDLITKGYTHAEIAERLVLSVRTVESHRSRIQRKLGRLTRSELIDYAHVHGIASPPGATAPQRCRERRAARLGGRQNADSE
jgi:two-component system response regulator NreC